MSACKLLLFLFILIINLFLKYDGFMFRRNALVVNDIVDPIIEKLRNIIIEKDMNKIKISGLNKTGSFVLIGKNISYMTFESDNCSISDLSTVYRIGDVSLQSYNSLGLNVHFKIGLKKLQYSCDNYTLKLPLMKFSGSLNVNINSNELAFLLTIHHENKICYFKINYIKVENLNDFKVKITGFSFLNSLINKIVSRVIQSYKESIAKQVEREILNSVTKTIEDTGICKAYKLL